MTKKEFLEWYATLENLRPFSHVKDLCADTEVCTDCPLRVGCPTRPMFYLDDIEFETTLQLSKAQTIEHMGQYGFFDDETLEERTEISYRKFKNKRQKEIEEHPEYSET